MFWKEIGKLVSNAWNGIKSFVSNTFGFGVVSSQEYDALSIDNIIYGEKEGFSTTEVIYGNVDKPVSLYIETASKWWEFEEYKLGMQFNINKGGVSFSQSLVESNLTFAGQNKSLDIIAGFDKIGYTKKFSVDFKNRTADAYYHKYIRTIPTATIVVVSGAAIYYTGGMATPYIVSIFEVGLRHVVS